MSGGGCQVRAVRFCNMFQNDCCQKRFWFLRVGLFLPSVGRKRWTTPDAKAHFASVFDFKQAMSSPKIYLAHPKTTIYGSIGRTTFEDIWLCTFGTIGTIWTVRFVSHLGIGFWRFFDWSWNTWKCHFSNRWVGILLMEEIRKKPPVIYKTLLKKLDILHINWCKISSISRMTDCFFFRLLQQKMIVDDCGQSRMRDFFTSSVQDYFLQFFSFMIHVRISIPMGWVHSSKNVGWPSSNRSEKTLSISKQLSLGIFYSNWGLEEHFPSQMTWCSWWRHRFSIMVFLK